MDMQNAPAPAEIEKALGLDQRSRVGRWTRRLVWLAVILAVVAGGAWWYLSAGSQTAAITYQTEKVQRTDLVVRVQATGNIQPTTQVDVSSEMSGVIRVVEVRNNSLVKKGEVLAALDAVRIEAQLARARAQLAAAEARLADARATLKERKLALERSESLSRKGISATQDLESARAATDRADAAVLAAEADLEVATSDVALQQTDLTRTRILSPVDGIVLKRTAEPGQTVAASLQAPVLFTIAEDLTRMQLEANVDEADIGAVKRGQDATFTVDAYPGQAFPAVIDTIEYAPNVTDNVVTYKAVLTVDNAALLLRPGMTATAQIVTQEVKGALAVPNAALRYEPPQTEESEGFSISRIFMPRLPRFPRSGNTVNADGERSLWVLENGVPREVKVRTGVTDGKLTEIVSGDIAEGAAVVTSSRQAKK